ncbi:HAMP domain-containing sensor histidine kinase [uncultured Clostridium sp.]|nr:HAMP domain-containing sensor histidine kinase [uncultured Clostridium sp.]
MSVLNRNSKRLLSLINNIIDTAKIDAGFYKLNITENDIVYLVEEVVLSMKDFAENSGLELIIDPEIEEKVIECDRENIERCIINLIGNAIKFTEEGGKVDVIINDNDQYVTIIVRDTGIGIEEKNYEAIFDRFSQGYGSITEEYGGSGLGLTITKQIINLHNGDIRVKSKVGVGSEFIIILPTKQI